LHLRICIRISFVLMIMILCRRVDKSARARKGAIVGRTGGVHVAMLITREIGVSRTLDPSASTSSTNSNTKSKIFKSKLKR
jgi:hypothetical protein